MKKLTLIIFLFIITAFFSMAEVPDFDPAFKISTNNDLGVDDFYDIKGDLKITFPVADNIDLIFKTELDKREVDIEELSARFWINDKNRIKAGKFENRLTLDQYLGGFDSLFGRNNIVTREIKNQGYTARSIGLKYERKNKDENDISYFAHFIYIPSQFEPQLDLGFLYREKDDQKLAGVLASYYPFINHDAWDGADSYSNVHNFLIDLIFTDYTQGFLYGAEFTTGSDLITPLGLINHDPETDYPLFMGLDIHAGFRFLVESKNFIFWIPALRLTVFQPALSEFKCRFTDIIFSNQLSYKNNVKLNIAGGPGFITRYDTYGDNELKTKLEWRWSITVIING